MFSRYDSMTSSNVVDEEDKEAYPDILSVNYNNTQLTQVPIKLEVNAAELKKFWVFMSNYYSYELAEADDVLLTINNIPYLGLLSPGDSIYKIALDDLYHFNNSKKPK